MASILPKEEKMTSAAVVQTRRPRRKTFYHVETPAFGFLGIFLAVCLLIFLITVLGKPVEGYIDKNSLNALGKNEKWLEKILKKEKSIWIMLQL